MQCKYLLAGALATAFGVNASAALIVNEVMMDPNGPGAADLDSNLDGTFDSSQDEYIEFVNDMGTSLDISGWTISDAVAVRHTVAASTVLAPGQAFVLFGGGSPDAADFGGAIVDTASTGFIGLNNGGDTIIVNDGVSDVLNTGNLVTGDGVSLTRDPDITGAFVLHDTTTSGLAGSPGFLNDGVTPIPEPATAALAGLGALAMLRRRSA